MDELAYALKMDPVELRLRNYADADPEDGRPWSSKSLKDATASAAERFGWKGRNPEPRSMRDGGDLVGWGMATATYPMNRRPASALARVFDDGSAVVETRLAGPRHRRLHGVDAGGGRRARPAGREGALRAGRHRPAAGRRFRRFLDDRQRRLGRAGGGGRGSGQADRPGDRRSQVAAARPGRRRRWPPATAGCSRTSADARRDVYGLAPAQGQRGGPRRRRLGGRGGEEEVLDALLRGGVRRGAGRSDAGGNPRPPHWSAPTPPAAS